jgi:5-formyltetrahydrofolate cyclo-ligase
MTIGASIDRHALRRRLIAERRDLGEDDHRERSNLITAHLMGLLRPFKARSLAFYWPHRREYDPRAIAERVIEEGGAAALPVVIEKDRALAFRQWHPDIEMMIGLYEIPHPAGEAAIIPDIVLVPTVGFDAACYRLGYGGGYYDRTIAAFAERPITIGVGFEFGRLDTIEPGPHDIPMDMIVTEAGIFRRS